jgi:RNA recognition motif-containing protein
MPVAFSDKPWTRASKDPSLIQRGTELFVGNLSLDTFENDLFDIFRDCGEIIDVCHRIY